MSVIMAKQSIEKGLEGKPELQKYASRLKEMDKDGDGTIDIDELCQAIDEMVGAEKQNRLLKKIVIVSAILAILAVAACVGLTAGVIILTQEVKDHNGALVSKETGRPMATAINLRAGGVLRELVEDPSPEAFANINMIYLPGATENEYSVHYASAYYVNANGTITIKTENGLSLRISADPESDGNVVIVDEATGKPIPGSEETGGSRRKLLVKPGTTVSCFGCGTSGCPPC